MERETRFLLLSLLLVVLPSLLLSYFGLQAIQKERQAHDARFRKTVERFCGEVAGEVEQAIRHHEAPLRQLLQSVSKKTGDPRQTAELFRAATGDSPYFGEVHLVDRQGRSLELAAAGAPPQQVLPPDPAMLGAARLEAQGKLEDALARFSELAGESTRSPRWRASALLGQARCLDKLGRADPAAAAYRILIETYPLAADHATGLVLSLGARRRLAELQSRRGKPAEAREWLELLTFLQAQHDRVPADQAAFYDRLAGQALERLLPQDGRDPAGSVELARRWRVLLARRRAAQEAARRKHELVARLAPTARRALEGELPPTGHVDLGGPAQRLFFFYGPIRSPEARPALVFVQLHPARILADVLPRYQRYPDLAPRVRDGAGRAVGPAAQRGWSLLLARSLDSIGLETTVWSRGPDPRATYSRVQTRTFAWVIALATGGILLGCFVILRAVTSELKAARQKSDFVSSVTHELKTPLTSIRMFVETLQLGRFHSEGDRQECLDRIERETGRLQRLIDRVLEFSKIDRGVKTFDFQPADPGGCLDQALRLFEAEHDPASYELVVERAAALPPVRLDPEAIVEVLLNLLQNAYKYSDPPRRITLGAETCGDQVRLWVRDEGIGIAPREQKKVFRKFYRADDVHSRRADGAGLGLTLCAAIVEAHQGRITLDSAPGRGSCFTVSLPCAGAALSEVSH